jgi:hypothetical protein
VTSEGSDTSRLGNDPGGLWAATVGTEETEWLHATNPEALLASQRAWKRAIEVDFPSGGDITCDPWTFMPLRESIFTAVAVTGPEPATLLKALDAAGLRMSGVLTDGREVSDEELEELESAWDEDEDGEFDEDLFSTPNYISGAERHGDIVGISNIDTKGVRYPWMFRTFLRILAEELRQADAVPARIIPFLTAEALTWLAERHERYPSPDSLN